MNLFIKSASFLLKETSDNYHTTITYLAAGALGFFLTINADAKLKALFGGNSQVSMFDLMKIVSKNVK